jgi:hypothetical protein
MRNTEACTILFGKREGKRLFERPGIEMEDNIKIYLTTGIANFFFG